MINLNDYFKNVSEFQIVGDMTGWTPSYLNSRNELWYIDPSRNRYMLNYENIENVFDSENIPLYADFLGCDSNDENEWVDDFKISYKNFKNPDMLKVFRLYAHPTKKANEWESKNAWMVGDGIFDYDSLDIPTSYISSINLSAKGWMYTYYIFENHYNHPWENTNFGKLPKMGFPNQIVMEKMFNRISSYFVDCETYDNAVFKFQKDKFLYIDWPDLITDDLVENNTLYKLYHKVHKIENPFQKECYYDSLFEEEREKLFDFLNKPSIKILEEKMNEILLDSDYYKQYSKENIINSLNYRNINKFIG